MKVTTRRFALVLFAVCGVIVRLLAAPSKLIFNPLLEAKVSAKTIDSFRTVSIRTLGAQLLSLLLLFSILTSSTPAMQPTILWASQSAVLAVALNETGQDIRYSYLNSSGFSNLGTFFSELNTTVAANLSSSFIFELIGSIDPILGFIIGSHIFKKRQQGPQRIVILPTNETNTLTVLQGEKINLTAVGLNREDQPMAGLPFTWTQTDTFRNLKPQRMMNNTFDARVPGTFIITAETLGRSAQINVTVIPNEGLGVQNLLAKAQSNEKSLSDTERKLLNNLRQKGLLTTREISTQGAHNPEEEERANQLYKEKREAAKIKQEELRAKNPNPLEQLRQRLNSPNSNQPPSQTRTPGGPRAEEVNETTEAAVENATSSTSQAAPRAESQIFNNNSAVAARTAAVRPPNEDFWDGGNYWQATSSNNWVGNTPGAAPSSGAANGNMTMAAPVISLGGRGIDVNLSLNYNSRLWSKAGSIVSYDPDKGNPAPGWNLGFGKVVNLGSGGCMLVDADGTRHSHSGSFSTYSNSGYYATYYLNAYTKDGTFINYTCGSSSSSYGSQFGADVRLSNGTNITYSSSTGNLDQAFPTKITDAQGNYITITYVNNQGPNIQTITDTLNRTITFNYDSSGRLVSVTGPAQNGGTRVYVRLHYRQLNLNYAFASGITADTPTNSPYVLDAIYYPEVGTGYWFGESDSYSSYGMIAKVMGMRQMTWTGTGYNDQGTITAGQMSHQEVYNFPLGPDSSLTDAPLYTTQTATWANIDTVPAVTTYATSSTSTDETVTVTAPNGTKSIQTSYNDPGTWNDGVYYKNETRDSANNLLGKTQTYMQQGEWGSFRPTKIETTDQKTQTTAVEFEYTNGIYNQVTKSKELNYGNQLYRETRTVYENNSSYIYGSHILNLTKSQGVYDAGGNILSRTDYEYDNNAVANGTSNHGLVATPGVVMHNYLNDPYTSELKDGPNCYYEEGYWVENDPYDPYDDVYVTYCVQYEQVSAYEPNTIFRGNVTKVKTYADAASLTGAIEYESTYDITGNLRTTTTNCCQQMSFNYTTSTQYSQPESHTKGSSTVSSPLRMTEYAAYDFHTGLLTASTNFNGRTTTYTYDAVNRPSQITSQNGAHENFYYNDAAISTAHAVTQDNSIIASYTESFMNGRGQQIRGRVFTRNTGNFYDNANFTDSQTKYDVMGRIAQTSVPYNATGNPLYWSTYTYDALSRVTQTQAPDGGISYTVYNEVNSKPSSAVTDVGQTVKTVDPWGRERWMRMDDFGRTVEVVEPNPAGNGTVSAAGNLRTAYTYDQLDQLVTADVVQADLSSQLRAFKYDSLGRLVLQKLAEQTATINNSGQFVGAGNSNAFWSDAFVYDARSNLVQKTDARGVKTNYNYQLGSSPDPLNRLQSISYDKSGAFDPNSIADAAPVTMTYRTDGDRTRAAMVVSGVTTEENDYNDEGIIKDYKVTLPGSQQQVTSYLYDTVNRLTEIRYPAQLGVAGTPRKIVTSSYDETSRYTQLKVDNQIQMDQIQYNPMSQVTALRTGAATGNADIETYDYYAQTGLLLNQTVVKANNSSQVLFNQTYEYQRAGSTGTTGQLTHVVNNLDRNKDRVYEFDTLGRLQTAKGGGATGTPNVTANWTQNYAYDRNGNRTSVAATGVTAASSPNNNVPTDGLPSQSYDQSSNRVNTTGYTYDLAGNLTRGQKPDGSWQRYEYDAAGRLVFVKKDDGWVEQANEYGSSRQRIKSWSFASVDLTYYVWGGSSVIAEYKANSATPTAIVWAKSYIYAGTRLLSTFTNNGAGGETLEFHHPDRLGTKLVTQNASTNTNQFFEQSTLPFGTPLEAESTGATNQRFTTYDRSQVAQLDYAINRTYSNGQGRFTSVDPVQDGMNLYAYANNNPVDFTDPSGLNAQATYYICYDIVSYDVGVEYKREPICHFYGGGGGTPSGGGQDDFGGSGGGGPVEEEQPAQNKNCSLSVRGTKGAPISSQNPSRTKAAKELGISKLGGGVNKGGYGYVVEIIGKVTDNINNWEITNKIAYISVTESSGVRSNNRDNNYVENISPGNQLLSSSRGNTFYNIDAPGLKFTNENGIIRNGYSVKDFTTTMRNKFSGETCSISWGTGVKIQDFNLVDSLFWNGNIGLQNTYFNN